MRAHRSAAGAGALHGGAELLHDGAVLAERQVQGLAIPGGDGVVARATGTAVGSDDLYQRQRTIVRVTESILTIFGGQLPTRGVA